MKAPKQVIQIAGRGRPLGNPIMVWLKFRFATWVASIVWKLLKFSLRRSKVGFAPIKSLVDSDKRFVLAFWHRRLVMMPLSYPFKRNDSNGQRRGVAILSSDSKDGEISAAIWRHLGIHAVRGTASHGGGAQGLVKMIQVVRHGWDLGITPDGPRGPRFEVKPGVVAVARKTRAWIVPVCVAYSSAWQLKTWDAMLIPKPFSKVAVLYGEPYQVPEQIEDEAPYALALHESLMELEKLADGYFG
ncbi:MAG: lysophospholipid acyltransferase family protein [Holophagaceae bacterium]|nr:lysophospholipid acyltransferase family protein [Holophagaceae bacterium]